MYCMIYVSGWERPMEFCGLKQIHWIGGLKQIHWEWIGKSTIENGMALDHTVRLWIAIWVAYEEVLGCWRCPEPVFRSVSGHDAYWEGEALQQIDVIENHEPYWIFWNWVHGDQRRSWPDESVVMDTMRQIERSMRPNGQPRSQKNSGQYEFCVV